MQLTTVSFHKRNTFYLLFIPFICQKYPFVKPFICNFIPFISKSIRNNGFTLIELVITLTIVAILLMVVAPNMSSFVTSNRLTTQANEFMADINLARSEAIKQSTNIGICASSDSATCVGNWQNGWIIYVAANNRVIRAHEPLTGNNTLSGPQTSLVFNNSGLLTSSAAAGNYTLCNNSGKSRVISIQATGRSSLSSGSC